MKSETRRRMEQIHRLGMPGGGDVPREPAPAPWHKPGHGWAAEPATPAVVVVQQPASPPPPPPPAPQAPNAPAAPAAPGLLAITATSIAVTWTASTADATHDAATSYTLACSPHGAANWTAQAPTAGLSATVTGLTAGTAYDFSVTASNAGGAGAASAIMTATTYATTIVLTVAPPASFAHGSGPAVTCQATPDPAAISAAWEVSATTPPAAADQSAMTNFSGSLWGAYPSGGGSNMPGQVYLWLIAANASGQTTGVLVTGPYTAT
jgi:hypothetical protein